MKSVFACKHRSLKIPTLLQSSHRKAGKEVLVDSGATDNFISTKVLKFMKIGSLKLPKPRTIWNIDGTHNKAGAITDFVDLQVRCGPKVEEMRFLVTDLGEDEIILGYPWLATFQPDIDWKALVLAEELQPLVIKTLGLNTDAEEERVMKAWVKRARSMAVPGEEIFVTRIDTETVTVPTVTLTRKVSPGLQDLQTRARRILAERNAEKAEENMWIGWMVVAESIGELNGLIKSRAT